MNNLCLYWQAQIVPDSEKNYNYCVYDSDISTGYGVGAFLFLMVSQVLIMFASRCFCCGKPLSPGGSRALALVLLIICWYICLSNHSFLFESRKWSELMTCRDMFWIMFSQKNGREKIFSHHGSYVTCYVVYIYCKSYVDIKKSTMWQHFVNRFWLPNEF